MLVLSFPHASWGNSSIKKDKAKDKNVIFIAHLTFFNGEDENIMKTLTENDHRFIKDQKNLRFQVPMRRLKDSENQKYFRLRQKAAVELEDLIFLSQNLSEDQLGHIFNEEAVSLFLHGLLHPKVETQTEKEKKQRKERLLSVSYTLLNFLSDIKFVSQIASDALQLLTGSEEHNIRALRALYLEGFYRQK